MSTPREAEAGRYDLDLTTLGKVDTATGLVDKNVTFFRSLSSEIGTLLAPKPVDPSDSLGLSGFAVTADLTLNTVSHTEEFWTQTANGEMNSILPTLQLMGRKGLWPGIEVGAGATKLFDSRMWSLNGYAKAALHEGFHHLPIPSIAGRVMLSKALGSKDLNLNTVSGDISISHSFGLGHTFNLTPYAGYQALFVIARTSVLDATPDTDEYPDGIQDPDPCGGADNPCVVNEFVFHRNTILRHRPFVGARLIFSVFRVGFEAMFATAGGSEQNVDGETAVDSSGFQQQYSLSLGLDF